ncbi:MAG: hypothetical protein K6F94_07305 [Bacteroidaceae bacterium]|nr:hypothetical protein [Bacteroidaceae bacterium]
MDRKELKREIIGLYAKCGSYILQMESKECPNGVFMTTFRHPTHRVLFEVWENAEKILNVFFYKDTTNAMTRNAFEVKTIEEFRKAVA